MTEEELIKEIERVFRFYGRCIYEQLRRKVGAQMAYDCRQEVMLSYLKYCKDSGAAPENPIRFLRHLANVRAVDVIRKTDYLVDPGVVEYSEDCPDIEMVYAHRERLHVIGIFVSTLSEREQEVYDAMMFTALSQTEAAKELGVSPSAICQQWHIVRRKISAYLSAIEPLGTSPVVTDTTLAEVQGAAAEVRGSVPQNSTPVPETISPTKRQSKPHIKIVENLEHITLHAKGHGDES